MLKAKLWTFLLIIYCFGYLIQYTFYVLKPNLKFSQLIIKNFCIQNVSWSTWLCIINFYNQKIHSHLNLRKKKNKIRIIFWLRIVNGFKGIFCKRKLWVNQPTFEDGNDFRQSILLFIMQYTVYQYNDSRTSKARRQRHAK